jgi:hypothetical protein
MNLQAILIILTLLLLHGCSEGGTGGTGLVNQPPPLIEISGQANKGPFEAGAMVRVSELNEQGNAVLIETVTTQASGRYDLSVPEGSVNLIAVTGHYFSEATGEYSSEEIELLGVFAGSEDNDANVNVLTHLIHDRVLQLIADGSSAASAIDMAQDEITLALSSLIPSPASAVRFTDLVVLNAMQSNPTAEGNGYLLALTSIIEQSAITLSAQNGTSANAELIAILDDLAADIAADGSLTLTQESQLMAARQMLDPNEIHQHLFEFDADFKEQALADLNGAQNHMSSELECHVNLDSLDCFISDSSMPQRGQLESVGSVSLTDIVADMNLFIDSDGDGIVNATDEDDDGDGIVDTSDSKPFATGLLVPAHSSAQFADYIKDGLRQWSGVGSDSNLEIATANPFMDDIGLPGAETTDAVDLIASVESDASADFQAGFTETNVLVAGVDEIDAVKYDGAYLYVANRDVIQVLETNTDGSGATVTDRISINTGQNDSNLLIRGLYFSADSNLVTSISEAQVFTWFDAWFSPWGWNGQTRIDLIDVSDVNNLSRINSLELDGSYINSRRIGNILYVVTRFTPSFPELITHAETQAERESNLQLIENLDVNELLPVVLYQDGTTRNLVTTDNCFLPPITDTEQSVYYPTLTTITAISLNNPSDITSVCLTDGIQGMHMSLNAIYLAALDSSLPGVLGYYDNTLIHKFSISDAAPAYICSGRVSGSFWGNPTYLMGEHNGNLTTVTTRQNHLTGRFEHQLTILGESATEEFSLVQLGQIPNDSNSATIGKPGEQIYASRILGDRAYIVTFEQIDPVYVIDLSDPGQPEILGELEIPGFSTYLHPVSDNLLLGVGRNTDMVDGRQFFQGINVRLFDVSNPAELSVLSDISIGRRGTETPVSWDPHAFTILSDPATGMHRFTLPVRLHGAHVAEDPALFPWNYYPWTHEALHLFEIDAGTQGMTAVGRVIANDFTSGYRFAADCCNWTERSFLNGETIHYLRNNRLYTALWDTPDVTQQTFIPTVFASEEPMACTEELRDGLSVTVSDQNTGAALTCASIVATDGDFSAIIQNGCDVDGSPLIEGLRERPGIYELQVTHAGYEDWIGSGIVVQADECHVHRTNVRVFLNPLE